MQRPAERKSELHLFGDYSEGEEGEGALFALPLDLELDFLGTVFALVFDVVDGSNWNVDALVSDLNFKGFSRF